MILYRLILALFGPAALVLRQALLALRGRAEPQGLAERLALRLPAATGPALWLHAASNGELASAQPALLALRARYPGHTLWITTNTVGGRALARRLALADTICTLAPLDSRGAVRRFLAAARPRAALVVENELWPERLSACAAAGIPVLVLGARMSARSHRLWARFPRLAAQVLAAITWLAAQDRASAQRFAELGLAPARIGPALNLKAILPPPPPVDPGLPFARATTLLAASTHEGEDEIVLDAFVTALGTLPALRLILAPRHPRRAAAIARAVRGRGLSLAVRSAGERPAAGTQVYLADTLGEMALWYAAAGMTLVAGSLLGGRGGHTPFEPAARHSAILHGPDVANFAEAYAALAAAGAARQVRDAGTLARAILDLAQPEVQADCAAGAERALAALSGPGMLDPFLAALDAAHAGQDR